MNLYENIKRRRQELGLSQTALALKVGYSDKTMIAKIEKGKVDLSESKIEEFARALNINPIDLIGWDGVYEPIFTAREYKLISSYRILTDEGKEIAQRLVDALSLTYKEEI